MIHFKIILLCVAHLNATPMNPDPKSVKPLPKWMLDGQILCQSMVNESFLVRSIRSYQEKKRELEDQKASVSNLESETEILDVNLTKDPQDDQKKTTIAFDKETEIKIKECLYKQYLESISEKDLETELNSVSNPINNPSNPSESTEISQINELLKQIITRISSNNITSSNVSVSEQSLNPSDKTFKNGDQYNIIISFNFPAKSDTQTKNTCECFKNQIPMLPSSMEFNQSTNSEKFILSSPGIDEIDKA